MATRTLKKYFKYSISFCIAAGLLWYLFEDKDISSLIKKAKNSDFHWIIISILLAMVSHIFRAFRWSILINPLGFKVSTYRAFLSLMAGYIANLIFPRLGEVMRCGILNKLENVPVSKSFGTVITERIIDLLVLVLLLFVTVILEYNRLKGFISEWFSNWEPLFSNKISRLFLFIAIVCLAGILVWVLSKRVNSFKKLRWIAKVKTILKEVYEGLTSIHKTDRQFTFWGSTIVIWVLYYLMSYIVVFSMPETSSLGWIAGLTILSMGSIGMAAPVQGGLGTYHAMVSSVLILYGINQSDGLLFATLLHSSHTLGVILVGGASLIIASVLNKRSRELKENNS